MSLNTKQIFPGAPNTERGRCCQINTHPDRSKIIYGSGNLVVTRPIDNNNDVHIYDQHPQKVTVAKFQPPMGGLVASADAAGNVRVWALNKMNSLKQEKKDLTLGVNDLCFTGDGKRLLVVGAGRQQYGVAYLVETGTSVGSLTQHSKDALSVDSRPERPYRAVTSGEDYQVSFYQGPPYKYEKSLEGNEKFVNCVRYSPNGEYLVTVGSDKTGYLYKGKEGDQIGQLDSEDGHTGAIYSAAWSPDSKQFVTAAADKSVKLWDAESRKCIATFTFPNTENNIQLGVAWTKEGPVSVSLNGDIHILDPSAPEKPKRTIFGHQKMPTGMVFDAQTNHIFTSAYDGLLSWEVGVGSKSRLTSDVITALTLAGDQVVAVNQKHEVRFLPVSSDSTSYPEEPAFTLQGSCSFAAVCPSDPSLVVFTTSKGISVARDQKLVKELSFDYTAETAAFSPDCKQLAVGGKDAKVRLYSFSGEADLNETATIEGHMKKITCLAYSADGKYLASGDYDKEIRVTDLSTNENAYRGLVYHTSAITSLQFHPSDSNTLLSGGRDGQVFVWSLEEKQRKSASAHLLGVQSVAWLKDGNGFVSFGNDLCLKTWEISSE